MMRNVSRVEQVPDRSEVARKGREPENDAELEGTRGDINMAQGHSENAMGWKVSWRGHRRVFYVHLTNP